MAHYFFFNFTKSSNQTKVCVSEGQFVPVHVKEEEILKIPIHIFGNGEKEFGP